jgi:ketosteroid isomerase-like protein
MRVIDDRDIEAFGEYLADDVVFRFGSGEPLVGKPAVEAAGSSMLDQMAASRHEVLNLWEVEEGVVVAEMNVEYERLDGRKLTLPCCNVFRVRDGRVYDYRSYMDINPLFAA